MRASRTQNGLALLAVVLAWFASACSAGYAGRFDDVRRSLERRDLGAANARIDAMLAKAGSGDTDYAADVPLLLLERASLRQAAGNHAAATADFVEVDPMLEVLDLTPDGASKAAEYLFTDDAGLYRPPVYEKLMVNVCSMASFLAQNDVQGALVESRRLNVLLSYFANTKLAQHPMLGAVDYLVGLTNEVAGNLEEAVRYYIDAAALTPNLHIDEDIVRIGAQTRLAHSSAVGEAEGRLNGATLPPLGEGSGEVIAVLFSGLPPYRVAERFPVGMVVNAFRGDPNYPMTDKQQSDLAMATAEDALTWVNYPVLHAMANARPAFALTTSGALQASSWELANVEGFAMDQWAEDQPGIAWSALTRTLTRVVAREVIQGTGRALDNQKGGGAVSGIFWLLGLVTQATMQAMDTPDTRTWGTMPAHISIARLRVPAGEHDVEVRSQAGAGVQRVHVEVAPGQRRVVVVRYLQ